MTKTNKGLVGKLIAVVPVIISALGGAMMVYSSYDDSPGGTLLGFGLIMTSIYLVIKKSH
jgi:hypothetical protein